MADKRDRTNLREGPAASVRVLLVRPRNPGNIGACARAMANFGLEDLVVLDPYEPIWQETRAAPEAEQVVLAARRAGTWEEAVRGCDLVLGTSSFHRRSYQTAMLELPELGARLGRFGRFRRAALVFGSERSGLSNEELAACQAVLRIPTVSQTPSMNLAQAVAVVLYEWRRAAAEPPDRPAPLPARRREALLAVAIDLADRVGYPPSASRAVRAGRLRRLAQEVTLSLEAERYLLKLARWMKRRPGQL